MEAEGKILDYEKIVSLTIMRGLRYCQTARLDLKLPISIYV